MTPAREGGWIQTASGRQFWPLDARPGDVLIEDVATALANLCRFGGQVSRFYSVAEHSCRVAWWCERAALARGHGPDTARRAGLHGLLHDAAEAYLVDVPTPIKVHLPEYQAAEARLDAVVRERFGLSGGPDDGAWDDLVREGDRVMLATEKRDLKDPEAAPWVTLPEPDPIKIESWSSYQARRFFLFNFRLYYGAES